MSAEEDVLALLARFEAASAGTVRKDLASVRERVTAVLTAGDRVVEAFTALGAGGADVARAQAACETALRDLIATHLYARGGA